MEKHYKKILKDTEERVASRLRAQEMDEKSPCYGGFYDTNRMVQAKYTIICVEPMITLYCNPDSRYYRNPLLAWRAGLGVGHIPPVKHTAVYSMKTAFLIMSPVIFYPHRIPLSVSAFLSRCMSICRKSRSAQERKKAS